MDHDELVAKFSQTVGVEKAEQLIDEAIEELGIEPADQYTHHEVADICETIQRSSDGYVRLVATEIRVYERAQRQFDALLDEITDPIVTVTFEAGEPIVTATNAAFEETFSCDASAIGDPLADVLDLEDESVDAIDRWRRSDRGGGVEVHHRTPDGELRTFLFRSVVVTRESGDVEGYGIYTDITERKRRERRLEHQNEQLERFTRVVSHDLRNPLSVLNGHLELALDAADPQVSRHLQIMADELDRMEQLVDGLLTLAKQGQVVDSPESVDHQAVVRAAWSNVETANAVLEIESGVDVTIKADCPRLLQLFENLFRNAVEHGSASPPSQAPEDAVEHGSRSFDSRASSNGTESGSANPDARRLETESGESGSARSLPHPWEEVVERRGDDRADSAGVTVVVGGLSNGERGFFIEDDGPGIDLEDRDRVFEHGYTTDSEGSGFGLAIVKAIAEAHDWSVSVTEGREGGARFEVTGVDRPED